MKRPKWGGAYAAKWVRLTLATFRHALPPVRPERSAGQFGRPHHSAIARRPGRPDQPPAGPPSARAVELQSTPRQSDAGRMVRREPATDPIHAHAETLARLVNI